MLTVGTCRVCEEGPLGLRLCGGCGRLVILCDECDATWSDADLDAAPTYADEETMPCPHCTMSLWEGDSRWATRDEAARIDWLVEAVEAGDLLMPEREGE